MAENTKAYELLSELYIRGRLTDHVQAGLVTARQKKHFDIYNAFRREDKTRFKTKSMKVAEVANRFNVSTREVYSSINFMER